jgi:hypothetical protein
VRERIAIGIGLAAVLAALAAVVSVPHVRENGTNSRVTVSGAQLEVPGGGRRCQRAEFIPAQSRGLRVYMNAFGGTGGPVEVTISAGGRVEGATLPRPRRDGPVSVRIPEVPRDAVGTVCFANRGTRRVALAGDLTEYHPDRPRRSDPREDVRLDWLREERTSLLSFAPVAARRFALFKAGWIGPWTFYALLAATLGLGAAALVAVRRAPRTPWACAGIATGVALVWAVLVPAFWVADEPVHFGYTQYLAETGHVPREIVPEPVFSDEERESYRAIGFRVLGRPSYRPDLDRRMDRRLDSGRLNRVEPKSAGYAVNNPPLYYALEAVPYRALHGASLWDRLFAMRVLSALLGGLAVAFAFLFLRELMPERRWAWTVGALAVAFQPVFGFMAGGVNNDVLVWTCGAALLWALARVFRRGLTPARGAAVAGALLVGILAKPSIYGVIPGVALALGLAAWRAAPEARRRARAGAGVAGAMLALPALAYLALSRLVLDRPGATAVAGFDVAPPGGSVGGQLAYLWQSFLPRLPFMTDQFTNYPHYLLWDSYLQGFIGRFGWFEYGYPKWAYWLGLAVLAGIVALAVRGLTLARAWGRRAFELIAYAAMPAGMLLTVGLAGYRYRLDVFQSFEQARYLFVVLPLWGAVVAAAACGAGRWARTAGTLLVIAAFGHTALSLLVTVERFYG